MPPHANGDLLCVFATKDGSVAINDPGGIYTSRYNGSTAGSYTRVLTAPCTTSSHTLTLTTATTDTWHVVIVTVRNPHATPFDFCARTGANDSTNPYAGLSGQSTANNNSVVFHFFGGDGGQGAICQSPAMNIANGDSGNGSMSVAYVFQPTSGSIPALDWYTGLQEDSQPGLMAIRLADATDIPPYAHPSQTVGEYLRPLHGATAAGTTLTFGDTWDTASPLSETALGGVNITFDAIGNVSDNGVNPYLPSASISPVSSATNIGGNEFTFGAALDMDTGILVGTYRGGAARDLAIDQGLGSNSMGAFVVLRSSSGNYRGYRVSSKFDSTTDASGRNAYAIGLNDGAVATLTGGTLNNSAVTSAFFMARAQYGTFSCTFSTLALVSKIGIHGGSTGTPLDFLDVALVVNSSVGLNLLFKRLGSAAIIYAPLQFGGSAQTVVNVNLRTFQFPTQYDGVSFMDWNVNTDVAGVQFYGVDASDSFSFTNCLFTSDSAYRWEFNASHSGSTPLNFAGTTVVGATVTLRATSDLDGMSFINCPTFTQNGATLTNTTFDNTVVDASSPANAALISDCAFVSDGTGHGLVVTGTAADFSLSGNTFDGFSGTGTDAAIYINIGSGTVNISITNGGDTPTIRTAGATVNVINARTVRVTCKDAADASNIASARVALYLTTGNGVTITRSGSTATVGHTAHSYANGQKVRIAGADQGEYNKIVSITNVTTNTYDYTVSGTPTTPATGTILSHRVVLDGTTNGSGVIEDTAYPYTSDQDVTGSARKGSGSPPYRPALISGTITSAAGFVTNTFMVSDA